MFQTKSSGSQFCETQNQNFKFYFQQYVTKRTIAVLFAMFLGTETVGNRAKA